MVIAPLPTISTANQANETFLAVKEEVREGMLCSFMCILKLGEEIRH